MVQQLFTEVKTELFYLYARCKKNTFRCKKNTLRQGSIKKDFKHGIFSCYVYETKTQVGLDETRHTAGKVTRWFLETVKKLEIAETFLYKLRKSGQLFLTFRQQKMLNLL